MIREDANFYYELYDVLKDKSTFPVILLALVPYLSLFVHESYRFISSRLPEVADSLRRDHEDVIRRSRNQVKLLDSRGSGLTEFIEYHRLVVKAHTAWFMSDHRGALGWFKRLIQPDLGLYTYKKRIFCTTHVAQLNLGQDPSEKGPIRNATGVDVAQQLRAFGYDIGNFIASVVASLGGSPSLTPRVEYLLDDNSMDHKDVMSQRYYRRIFHGISDPAITGTLLLLLSRLNFLRGILGSLVVGSPPTYFKIKFITIYHAGSSLSSLQNYCYSKDIHTKASKEAFAAILSDPQIRTIRRARELRNALVHYESRGVPDALFHEGSSLARLVECFFGEGSFEGINQMIDRQITRISMTLNEWLTSVPTPNTGCR